MPLVLLIPLVIVEFPYEPPGLDLRFHLEACGGLLYTYLRLVVVSAY